MYFILHLNRVPIAKCNCTNVGMSKQLPHTLPHNTWNSIHKKTIPSQFLLPPNHQTHTHTYTPIPTHRNMWIVSINARVCARKSRVFWSRSTSPISTVPAGNFSDFPSYIQYLTRKFCDGFAVNDPLSLETHHSEIYLLYIQSYCRVFWYEKRKMNFMYIQQFICLLWFVSVFVPFLCVFLLWFLSVLSQYTKIFVRGFWHTDLPFVFCARFNLNYIHFAQTHTRTHTHTEDSGGAYLIWHWAASDSR